MQLITKFVYKKYTEGSSLETAVRMNPSPNSLVIAAAYHEGGFIPGLFNPMSKECLIPWNCVSNVKEEFYILHQLSGSSTWTEDEEGHVPPNAVRGAYSEGGETLFIGKYNLNGKWLCGKIHPSHGVCYVADAGLELNSKTYLVLCAENYNPEDNPCILQE